MRKTTFLFTLLLVAITLCSCDKDDVTYQDKFEKSLNAWKQFKASNNDSYTYTTTGSTWVGASWETTITVVSGEVVCRSFRVTRFDDTLLTSAKEMEWTELYDEINTHTDTPASEAVTLDHIYDKARNVWLKKRKGATTYLEIDNDGMISYCGYVPNNCVDDCFFGITISSFTAC